MAIAVMAEMTRIVRVGGYVLVEFVNADRPFKRDGQGDVNFSTREVFACLTGLGCKPLSVRGAFFFSMTVMERVPGVLLPALFGLERLLGRLTPRLCSRCYVLAQRVAGRS